MSQVRILSPRPIPRRTSITCSARLIADTLAPTGILRAAINFGNPVLAQRHPVSGEPGGVSVDLARALGERTGLSVQLVAFDAAGKVFEAIRSGAWDVAFLAIDPERAEEMLFTAPYVIIEGGYLVRLHSPLSSIAQVDQTGMRVAVASKSAYDLHLTRTLKRAEIVRAPTGDEAIAMFLRDGLEVAAGVKGPLLKLASADPRLRVMDGRFMSIEQAMAVPRGRNDAWRYLTGFIEEMKASGFVLQSLQRSGQFDAQVAPPDRRSM